MLLANEGWDRGGAMDGNSQTDFHQRPSAFNIVSNVK